MTNQERDFVEMLRRNYTVVIINEPEINHRSVFVVDEFKPYNPSNHHHLHEILGKDVTGIVKDFGAVSSDQMLIIKSIETRISELPSVRTSYSNHYRFEWIRRV